MSGNICRCGAYPNIAGSRDVRDRLAAALTPYRNRDAAYDLATFLGRFWSHPQSIAARTLPSIDHPAHFFGQPDGRERLSDEVHALIETPMVDDGVTRIAGREQTLRSGRRAALRRRPCARSWDP